jgi:hypothetical protein
MSFKSELKLAADDVKEFTEVTWRLSVNEAFIGVVVKTPVRDGGAKASFFCSAGRNGGAQSKSLDKSGQVSIDRINDAVAKSKAGGTLLLYSNLIYIELLEEGYSEQAPSGMIKTTVADWPSIVKRNI